MNIKHDDLCALSRLWHEYAFLQPSSIEKRVNDWLKEQLAKALDRERGVERLREKLAEARARGMPVLEPLHLINGANATFYAFNVRGSHKWKYSGRGYLSPEVFGAHTATERRDQLLRDNGGYYPGMSTRADDMVLVVVGDESVEWGFPLMLCPERA